MNPCVFDLIWGTGANWGLCVPRLGKSFLGARGGSGLSGSFECGHLAFGPCLPLCPPLAPLHLCSIMGSRTKRASRGCLRGKEMERQTRCGSRGEEWVGGTERGARDRKAERGRGEWGWGIDGLPTGWLEKSLEGAVLWLQGPSLLSGQGLPSTSENKVPPAATSAVLGVSRKEKDSLTVPPPSFLCISAHRHWFPNPALPATDSRASKGHMQVERQVEMHVVPRAASALPSHRWGNWGPRS